MAKFIEITSSNGYVYRIPAEVVAADRAKYYSDREEDTDFDEEYKYTLEHDYELSDWFGNNMDWDDVEHHAILVDKPAPELDKPVVGQDEFEIVND